MVREIIKDIEFLKQKSERVTRADRQAVTDLLDTVEANKERCVGMAANMIGVKKTILVFLSGGKYQVMINPVITGHSKQYEEKEEGCLSLSGTRKARRYEIITVEYQDRNFKKKKAVFRGFEAQIIQHEADHFEGIII